MNHRLRAFAGITALVVMVSGCVYFPAAVRQTAASGGQDLPWWCTATETPDTAEFPAYVGQTKGDLSVAECHELSLQLDAVRIEQHRTPTFADDVEPLVTGQYRDGSGVLNVRSFGPFDTELDLTNPVARWFESDDPDAKITGLVYAVLSPGPPEGFAGGNDWWQGGLFAPWVITVRVDRPYAYQPDIFAQSHPCLATGVVFSSTTDPCYVASQVGPLQVLITNDDGIGADGIDELVNQLLTVDGIDVTVVAPATNQSGSGDSTTPGGATGGPGATASGVTGTAVNGTPADSVNYALDVLGLSPDLVLSGMNEGQNMTVPITNVSGTVGAARTAKRRGVPAIATSQGTGAEPDFAAGAEATLELLEAWRMGSAGEPFMVVPNLNIPTCETGSSIRGTLSVDVDPAVSGPYTLQDCTSTVPASAISTDIIAFNNGFTSIADVGTE
jgi:5'-nucleotidase